MSHVFVRIGLFMLTMTAAFALAAGVVGGALPSGGEVRFFFWTPSGVMPYTLDLDRELRVSLSPPIANSNNALWLPDGSLTMFRERQRYTLDFDEHNPEVRRVFISPFRQRQCFTSTDGMRCFDPGATSRDYVLSGDIVWLR